MFLRELRQKQDVESAVFFVDGAQHLQTALTRTSLRFQTERTGNRNCHRANLPRTQTPHFFDLTLFQPRTD